jgi:putative glycosyltransferase
MLSNENKIELSIVTTMYRSAPYLQEFHARIAKVASTLTSRYEIIFVDDGSPDHSLEIAQGICNANNNIKIVELSRNFGHHKAMATGLKYAKGEYIFLIDCDLEEDPELLQSFWHEMQQHPQLDVVFGVQQQRKGHWFERVTGDIYYKVLNKMSDEVKSAKNISTVRLMKKNYVQSLLQFQEQCYYFGPISNMVGFRQKSLLIHKKSKSTTSYHFLKKYHLFLDSIISFSSKPLYFIFYFGTCVTLLSFCYMTFLVIRKIGWGIAIQGWTSLVVLTSLFGGINIFFMGIMSVYILHIFRETKGRPFTLVRDVYTSESVKDPQIVKTIAASNVQD